jgi:anti-sigma regulatory factor (Ser/Thr protein kinase)
MAMNRQSRAIPVTEQSQIGEARRAAVSMAAAAGLGEAEAGKLAITVTEAATNILKHGGGGEILLRSLDDGIEMLAIDRGPGIANLAQAFEDGHSTAGTQGTGLGAISRLATMADIYTGPKLGTALLARFQPPGKARQPAQPDLQLEFGVAQGPFPGERVCGDAWACAGSCLFLADGLGHGEQAAAAAEAAVEAFAENRRLSVSDTIEAVHVALRGTRGAAVALACLDTAARVVRFCGLGNISAVVVAGGVTRNMVSQYGTGGYAAHRIAQYEYALPAGALVILHSDGLSAKWDLQSYPGLDSRDPSLIASVLYRDSRRARDDATILVARERP